MSYSCHFFTWALWPLFATKNTKRIPETVFPFFERVDQDQITYKNQPTNQFHGWSIQRGWEKVKKRNSTVDLLVFRFLVVGENENQIMYSPCTYTFSFGRKNRSSTIRFSNNPEEPGKFLTSLPWKWWPGAPTNVIFLSPSFLVIPSVLLRQTLIPLFQGGGRIPQPRNRSNSFQPSVNKAVPHLISSNSPGSF